MREAHFFHGHMVTVEAEAFRREPEAFDCFLSAFLSAANSVVVLLRTTQAGRTTTFISRGWRG